MNKEVEEALRIGDDRKVEEYIKQLEFNVEASKKEHKHDVAMIDEVKGEAVKLYKEKASLKEELEMYKDIKEVANMKLDRLANPLQQLEVNVMLDRQCKNLKATLDKVINKLKEDIKKFDKLRKSHEMYSPSEERLSCKYFYAQEILNIIEGEENG